MEITFLGTGCMSPTKKRNHQAMFLKYRDEGLLFDCGEGTQRQFLFANIKMTKSKLSLQVVKILQETFQSIRSSMLCPYFD